MCGSHWDGRARGEWRQSRSRGQTNHPTSPALTHGLDWPGSNMKTFIPALFRTSGGIEKVQKTHIQILEMDIMMSELEKQKPPGWE